MRHPQDDVLNPHLAGFVDDGLQGRNHDLTALQAKPLLRRPLPGQEVFKPAWGGEEKGGEAGAREGSSWGLGVGCQDGEAMKSRLSAQSGAQHRHPDALPARSIGLGEAEAPPSLTRGLWLHPFPGTTFSSPSSQAATRAIPLFSARFPPAHVPWSSLIMFQRPPHGSIQTPAHMSLLSEPLYSQQLGQGLLQGPTVLGRPSFTEAQLCPTCRKSLLHSLHAGTSLCPFHPRSVSFPRAPPSPAFTCQVSPHQLGLGMSQTALEQAPQPLGLPRKVLGA